MLEESFNSSNIMPAPSSARKRKSIRDSESHNTPSKRLNTSSERYESEKEDNQERSRRRSIVQLAAQSTVVQTKEKIMPQLELCMKLYASNKIDNKNVWVFEIIDILSVIAREDTFDKETLKIATSSLEAGTKVFGLRVDCVHNQTLQLASNMIRNFERDQRNADGGDEIEGEGAQAGTDGDPVPKKTKRKAKPLRELLGAGDYPSTVCPDSKMYGDVKQLPSVDFQIKYKGRFNRFVKMDHKLRYKFMTDEPYFAKESDLADYNEAEYDEKFEFPPLAEFKEEEQMICPLFQNFDFLKDDELDDDDLGMRVEQDKELVFDDDGLPIPELDGSIHDPFQDPELFQDDDVVVEEVQAELGRPNVEYITDGQALTHVDECDMHFLYQTLKTNSSHMLVNLWAGPSHWSLKCIKQARTTFTGSLPPQEKKVRRAKNKEQIVELNFDAWKDKNIPKAPAKNLRKKAAKKSKPLPYCVPSQIVDDTLIPRDIWRDVSLIPPIPTAAAPPEGNEDLGSVAASDEYNYDNPNDSQFCAGSDEPEYQAESHLHEVAVDAQAQDGGLVNIEKPQLVAKSTIGYARQAKRMNMKLLKCAVWDLIAGANTYKTLEIDANKNAVVGEHHFTDMYNNLPNKINQQMTEALSAPLAFSALLHLANEKQLILNGVPTYDDIIIKQYKCT